MEIFLILYNFEFDIVKVEILKLKNGLIYILVFYLLLNVFSFRWSFAQKSFFGTCGTKLFLLLGNTI